MIRFPYFVSDHHFFHKNIQKFCPNTRIGKDVEDMNRLMIEAHNSRVDPKDDVYFLGDFSFGRAIETENVLSQLNGHKHLIYGNHDGVIKNNSTVRSYFDSVQDYKEIVVEGVHVVMFHFPQREWNKMHRGSYCLFGHVHGSLDSEVVGRSMDVGIDTRPTADMAPWSWPEIHATLKDREVKAHHGKAMV